MRACAYVVGPTDGPGAALQDLARGLGFSVVLPYTGLANAETQSQQTPLMFFLFAAVDEVGALKTAADAIRFAPGRRIRFSPLVYFSESPSLDAIRLCIDMGFDDVITLPFSQRRVEERLKRLVDHTQVYFETSGYFGPDRKSPAGSEVISGAQYRRLEIIRTPASGVNVMRDEVVAAA